MQHASLHTMLTAVLLETVGSKALDTIAEEVEGTAIVACKEWLGAHFDNAKRFESAVREERESILWTLHAVLIDVASAVFGRRLDGEQAARLLRELACDPRTRRRFHALLNEATTSTDERIAMLAVGYFIGAESTTMRERLDWALRALFPDDADTLRVVVAESDRLFPGNLIAFDSTADEESWSLVTRDTRGPELENGRKCSAQSLRALNGVHCISISIADARNVPSTQPHPNEHIRLVRHRIEILPLGRELHRIFGTIDWRETARRRGHGGAAP